MTEAKKRTFTFFGRVLPEREPISFNVLPSVTSVFPTFGITLNIATSIHRSQVVSTVIVENGTADLDTLRNLVESSIRVNVDLAGYLAAVSFDLEILSVSWDEKERYIYGINIPILSARRAQGSNVLAPGNDLFTAVNAETAAHIVLEDFREAMRVPRGTGFFCYRAIEAMMQSMKMSDKEDEGTVSWPRFRKTLWVSKDALLYLKGNSDFPRHGKPSSVTDEDRSKIFIMTDEIIGRYFRYLVDGKVGLSEKDYPEIAKS